MEFMDVVRLRKSVRSYGAQDVEDSKLDQILESARLAPSWANTQCWRFIVVRDQEKIKALTKAAGPSNSWMKDAPVVIVACGDPRRSGTCNDISYYTVDVSIAMEHLILAAADLGLGTCWIGYFEEDKVKAMLGIPAKMKVVALTPVGYPSSGALTPEDITQGKNRMSLDEMVHIDTW
jgi:nitroreductase